MINTALTCEVNRVGSHYNIWRPFMSKLLTNMSSLNSGIVYVLFGSQAASFQSCIVGQQHILKEYHPAYYARTGEKMSHGLFVQINQLLDGMYGEKISFYKETDYGVC